MLSDLGIMNIMLIKISWLYMMRWMMVKGTSSGKNGIQQPPMNWKQLLLAKQVIVSHGIC